MGIVDVASSLGLVCVEIHARFEICYNFSPADIDTAVFVILIVFQRALGVDASQQWVASILNILVGQVDFIIIISFLGAIGLASNFHHV